MPRSNRASRTFLGRLPLPERTVVADAPRTETVGGIILLPAAAAALVWANTPSKSSYEMVREFHFGVPALGLDLSVAHWTADGLLAIFFFVAGAEQAGTRRRRTARPQDRHRTGGRGAQRHGRPSPWPPASSSPSVYSR